MLLSLFLEFMLIGALSFGGGYGALTLIEDSIVLRRGWLTVGQLADLITMAEITPGPIALNAASFTGFTLAGIPGAVIATVGCVLPSCVLVSLLAYLYVRFSDAPLLRSALSSTRAAVCSLIFSAFLTVFLLSVLNVQDLRQMASGQFQLVPFLLFAGSLVLCRNKKISPIIIILLCGVCGVLFL